MVRAKLTEKQKVRFMYGMTEKQFRKLFDKAGKLDGIHGHNFKLLLESRLDSLVYRAGFAATRQQARQIVNHGHVLVDGKKATIASMHIKPGQHCLLKLFSRHGQRLSNSEIKPFTESVASCCCSPELPKSFSRAVFLSKSLSSCSSGLQDRPPGLLWPNAPLQIKGIWRFCKR